MCRDLLTDNGFIICAKSVMQNVILLRKFGWNEIFGAGELYQLPYRRRAPKKLVLLARQLQDVFD